ncbi:MAG TPA: amidophosphoribosyltransferase [Lachnospiraceae bacterium]|nr:amidophosphoribosyltransferase [Lachnospiraceae bacterium]
MRFSEILFPDKCILCQRLLKTRETGVCSVCQKKLPEVREPVCRRCGKPIADPEAELCFDCGRRVDGALTENAALFVYNEDMRRAMAEFKYGGCFSDAAFYADQIAGRHLERIRGWHIDAIVPVPIHRRREWFRGYNQAGQLACELGLRLGLPVVEALVRSRQTRALKELDPGQRRKMLKGVFELSEKGRSDIIGGANILLVDDIYTTGATLDECARVLLMGGAGSVYGICLCIGSESV